MGNDLGKQAAMFRIIQMFQRDLQRYTEPPILLIDHTYLQMDAIREMQQETTDL